MVIKLKRERTNFKFRLEFVSVVSYVEFTPVIQHGGYRPALRWGPPDETGPSQRSAEWCCVVIRCGFSELQQQKPH